MALTLCHCAEMLRHVAAGSQALKGGQLRNVEPEEKNCEASIAKEFQTARSCGSVLRHQRRTSEKTHGSGPIDSFQARERNDDRLRRVGKTHRGGQWRSRKRW